jgi:hypothetical protein
MATKLKLMKFLQEARALAEVTDRRPAQRSSVLYLIQLRSHVHEITMPRRRLLVSIDMSSDSETPQPVKINFPDLAEATAADTMTV